MNKYTLIGSITFLIALSEIAFLLCLWVFVMPKMFAIYDSFKVEISYWPLTLGTVLLSFLGLGGLFVAYKLFSKDQNNKNIYFNLGIIQTMLVFVLVGIFAAFVVHSAISPIYTLSTVLEPK